MSKSQNDYELINAVMQASAHDIMEYVDYDSALKLHKDFKAFLDKKYESENRNVIFLSRRSPTFRERIDRYMPFSSTNKSTDRFWAQVFAATSVAGFVVALFAVAVAMDFRLGGNDLGQHDWIAKEYGRKPAVSESRIGKKAPKVVETFPKAEVYIFSEKFTPEQRDAYAPALAQVAEVVNVVETLQNASVRAAIMIDQARSDANSMKGVSRKLELVLDEIRLARNELTDRMQLLKFDDSGSGVLKINFAALKPNGSATFPNYTGQDARDRKYYIFDRGKLHNNKNALYGIMCQRICEWLTDFYASNKRQPS